jgi:hypothetical protein
LLGVLLLRSALISGLHANGSTAYGRAVVFGFSQEAHGSDPGGQQIGLDWDNYAEHTLVLARTAHAR